MRDANILTGPKLSAFSLEEAHAVVASRFPGVIREGSVGCWIWLLDEMVVAEGWVNGNSSSDTIWYRVKQESVPELGYNWTVEGYEVREALRKWTEGN